jgi:NifU-like protein
MWDYTDKVLDHFRNPRNVGYIKNPDGVGEVGSMACGDALRLMFKLDDQGRIADVKFQTFGCGSAIASSSALTEMIKGKTLEEAEKVTNLDIVKYLGGLPEQKMHCSVMGREALEAAIENYRTGADTKVSLEGKVVCVCFGVTEEKIKRAIIDNGLTTVEQVTNYTKAGGGCGGCKDQIAEIIKELVQKGEIKPKGEPAQSKRMTNLERIRLIQNIFEEEIKPDLAMHGGNIELVDVEGNRVVVSLKGTCEDCCIANVTIKDFVEPKLRQHLSEDIIVVEEK